MGSYGYSSVAVCLTSYCCCSHVCSYKKNGTENHSAHNKKGFGSMKICMLAPEFLPVWGGVGTYIVDLVRHLPKDTEVHVVTPMREGFGKDKISSSDYDFSKYFGNNVHVHFISDANDTFVYNAKFQYSCLRQVP